MKNFLLIWTHILGYIPVFFGIFSLSSIEVKMSRIKDQVNLQAVS